ncbi:hypothetical protein MKW94_026542 [Papaver nudicaule]|uniref:WRKY domain-containing protein n=1 Tax=Papaver nudicaule TaxID=74823 RepID=A0AA41VUU2_PAPNU|nr:hypothetical protein [Papaver nudicaule]
MEKITSYLDQKPLILNELTQAKELLKQLESQLGAASPSGNLLLPRILSSFENSLSMLNGIMSSEAGNKPQTTGLTESTCVVIGNRRRNCGSDLIGNPSKKRKMVQRWTEQVRVCEDSGLEGPLDDGYGWRKYGQKEILGASHPRGYFRCTHRNTQGCSAMKQVQRSDEDPSMFTVTYRGRHTCVQAVHLLPGQSQKRSDNQHDQKRMKTQGTIINFQNGCHDKTEKFSASQVVLDSSSFSFPSASTPIPSIEKENNSNNFSSMTPDNHFMNNSFSSPSTSESNSFSPYRVNSSFGEGQSIQQTSEVDLGEFTAEVDLSELTSAFDPTDLYLDFDFLDSLSFDL